MRALSTLVVVVAALSAAPAAHAQPGKVPPPKVVKDPPPPPLVGLTKVGELRPARGYVDDAIIEVGGALVALVHDGADIRVTRVGLTDGAIAGELPIGATAPEAARVVPVGDRLLVIRGVEAPWTATLLDAGGKAVRSWKPADAVAVRTLGGKPAVVTATITAKGKATVHAVAAFDLASGKKLPKLGKTLTLGPDGRDAKLDFRPVYFTDDHTVAVGVRGGVWRKAENQRSPDSWASYDLLTGGWLSDTPITDPMGMARAQPILAAHSGEKAFVRMAEDLSALELWQGGAPRALTLDQPLDIYDPTSVQYAARGDTLWLSLTVDPTNPPAVRRQKADPRYLDLFELQGDRAVRRARLLLGKTGVRWGWVGDVWWVLDKGATVGRGGPALTLYRL